MRQSEERLNTRWRMVGQRRYCVTSLQFSPRYGATSDLPALLFFFFFQRHAFAQLLMPALKDARAKRMT